MSTQMERAAFVRTWVERWRAARGRLSKVTVEDYAAILDGLAWLDGSRLTAVDDTRATRLADLPERVVVGANGAYWRDYGDGYSMCPVSDDNDPVVPVAVYTRTVALDYGESRETLTTSEARERQLDEFMGWLFRDGGAEPPRRNYAAVAQRLRLLVNPPASDRSEAWRNHDRSIARALSAEYPCGCTGCSGHLVVETLTYRCSGNCGCTARLTEPKDEPACQHAEVDQNPEDRSYGTCTLCGATVARDGPRNRWVAVLDATSGIEIEHLHDLDDSGTCRGCGDVVDCGCPFRGHGFRHAVTIP